jgi:8-oxo-dGTP pyrophosphatase MutT (NUDIX family)
MSSKSIVILYAIDPNTNSIKLLIGKHSVYNDLMFIGGGKKKTESDSLCVSRELYEETRTIFGPVKTIHKLIEEQSVEHSPIYITRHIERRNKKISIKLKVTTFLLRINYDKNIGYKFKNRKKSGICYNELSEIFWINLSKLDVFYPLFFEEDQKIIREVQKESKFEKLIKLNQKKQVDILLQSEYYKPKDQVCMKPVRPSNIVSFAEIASFLGEPFNKDFSGKASVASGCGEIDNDSTWIKV